MRNKTRLRKFEKTERKQRENREKTERKQRENREKTERKQRQSESVRERERHLNTFLLEQRSNHRAREQSFPTVHPQPLKK